MGWFCRHARPWEHCVSCAENTVVRNAEGYGAPGMPRARDFASTDGANRVLEAPHLTPVLCGAEALGKGLRRAAFLPLRGASLAS